MGTPGWSCLTVAALVLDRPANVGTITIRFDLKTIKMHYIISFSFNNTTKGQTISE
jgi:hypothetical protein